MLIEFSGDIITQPFQKIKKILPFNDIDIDHLGIDQVITSLLRPSKADIFISHVTLDYFYPLGVAKDEALGRMQAYCEAVKNCAASNKAIIVVNSLMLPAHRLVGSQHIADLRLVMQLNELLFQLSATTERVSIADVAGALMRCGVDRGLSATNNAVMRMPYTNVAMPLLLAEYARIIRERFIARKKVILLDADNTLWGGVIGEDGVTGIQVDDQYPGILYRRFQSALQDLRTSGLLLCLVTKNNEADVREAFDRLDMPLAWDSFAAIRANWDPKSANIDAIAKQLNVGVDSMVFIDDNPVELAEVAARFPTLQSRQFNIREAADAVAWLSEFDDIGTWSPSTEDLAKSDQYQQEAQRQQIAEQAGSIEDYIASLGIVIEAGVNRRDHVKRIAQLTNKTNQFNLTTRRYSEGDILSAMDEGKVFDFRVRDRFGDMGIIAVAVVRDAAIETFLMSCRALGRKIEEDIMKFVVAKSGASTLTASFIPSGRNPMVAEFYDSAGFSRVREEGDVRHYAIEDHGPLNITNELIEVS